MLRAVEFLHTMELIALPIAAIVLVGAASVVAASYYAGRRAAIDAYRDLEHRVDGERLKMADLRDEAAGMLERAEAARNRAAAREAALKRSQRKQEQPTSPASLLDLVHDQNAPEGQRLEALRRLRRAGGEGGAG